MYGLVPSLCSKPKFLLRIERLVNQQVTSTSASIFVSSAATTSKRQPPEHILLPEHSSHVKFRPVGSASLFGCGGKRQIEATGENEHPYCPDRFCKSSVASGKTCNRSNNQKQKRVPQGPWLVAKNVAVCKERSRCSL